MYSTAMSRLRRPFLSDRYFFIMVCLLRRLPAIPFCPSTECCYHRMSGSAFENKDRGHNNGGLRYSGAVLQNLPT